MSTQRSRSILLQPSLAELHRARAFFREAAAAAGFTSERAFDITVSSAEAVENAIEHAESEAGIEVRADVVLDRLEITVQGTGEFRLPNPVAERDHRGLGLPLMAKLSDHLTVYAGPEGRTVVTLGFYLPGAKAIESPVRPSLLSALAETSLLSEALDHLPEGINMLDLSTGRYLFMNPAQVTLTGFTADEMARLSAEEVFDRVHPEDREIPRRQQELLAAGETLASTVEYRWRVKSGEYRWFSDSRKLVKDGAGRPLALIGVSRDITERKRAEEALRESEERFRSVLQDSRDAIYRINLRTGRLEYMSPSTEQLTGYTAEEMMQLDRDTALSLIHAQDLPAFLLAEARAEEVGSAEVEYRQRTRDGDYRWLHNRMTVVKDRRGRLLYQTGSIRDVTERKRAQEALEEASAAARAERERLALLIDSMVDEVWFLDREGRLTLANPSAADGFALESEFSLVEDVASHFEAYRADMTPRPASEAPARRALSGEVVRGEEEMVRAPRSAELRHRIVSAAPVRDAKGEIVGSVSVVHDITEARQTAGKLRETERKVHQQWEELRILYDSAPVGLLLLDRSLRYVRVNRRLAEINGLPPEAHIGRTLWEVVPGVAATVERHIRPMLEGGEPVVDLEIEGETPARPGVKQAWLHRCQPIVGVDGKVEYLSGMVIEETERQEGQKHQRDLFDRLQRVFLDKLPQVPQIEFAYRHLSATSGANVGGDFYDLFYVGPGALAILIGDVSGQGIEASRIALLVKDAMQTLAIPGLDPGGVLEGVNALLNRKGTPGFVTAFLGFLDLDTGELTYSSAGHPSPLVSWGMHTQGLSALRHPPLGALPGTMYGNQKVLLDKACLLLLYTDGITEARRDGRFYGDARLASHFVLHKSRPLSELPDLLVSDALAFANGTIKDDAALLVLRYLGCVA